MELRPTYIEPIVDGFTDYLAPFKVGGTSIPVIAQGNTDEASNPRYPHFYLRNFRYMPDRDHRQSGRKYVYAVDTETKVGQRKLRPQPYIMECVLELADRNPLNFYRVYELLETKRQRQPSLTVELSAGTTVELPLTCNPPRPNSASAVLHVFWTVQVRVMVDPSLTLESVEVVETVKQNGELV